MAVIIMAVILDCSIEVARLYTWRFWFPFFLGTFVRGYIALLLYDTPAHVYWEMRVLIVSRHWPRWDTCFVRADLDPVLK